MNDNEERAHCLRRATAIAGPFSPLATPIADAIESERQSAREPLEARVRELEAQMERLQTAAFEAGSTLAAIDKLAERVDVAGMLEPSLRDFADVMLESHALALIDATLRDDKSGTAQQPETFDPQAVRELLDVIDSIQAGGGPLTAPLLGASRRVRESEKK